jgi:hypothetical protein
LLFLEFLKVKEFLIKENYEKKVYILVKDQFRKFEHGKITNASPIWNQNYPGSTLYNAFYQFILVESY